MSEKDNPEATGQLGKKEPVKRDTAGLMGVKASMPGAQEASPVVDKTAHDSRRGFSITEIESVAVPPKPEGAQPGGSAGESTAPRYDGGDSGGLPPAWQKSGGDSGGTSGSGGNGGTSGNWQRMVDFRGEGWPFFKLLFVNMLLTIITLGVYVFWAKTKVRRYLWSNSHVLGQPLEYTGTGKELFISFIIAMPCLTAGLFLYQFLLIRWLGRPLFVLAVVAFCWGVPFLGLLASYLSMRYRLSRTRWRGIRGNLSGSAVTFANKGTGWLLLMFVTFGIATPWVTQRIVNMQLNHVWFGNRRLQFNGPAKELVKSYFLMMLAVLALFVISSVIGYSAVEDLAIAPQHGDPDMDALSSAVGRFVLAYVIFFLGMLVCTAYYQATFYQWIIGHMAFGKMAMRSRISGAQVLALRLTNMLIIVFTLGLGLAWTRMRTMRLYLHSIDYKGDLELTSLLQDTQPVPSRGEGLLEALDMDIGF